MKKRNQIAQVAILTVAGVSSLNAVAQEVETGNMSVTVQNAFTLAQTTPLSFGTVRAKTEGTNIANLIIPSDPNDNVAGSVNANASIASIVDGNAAEWSVSDVSAFALLEITLPTTASNVTGVALPPGTPGFTADDFTAYVLSGPNANTVYASAGDLQADINGDVTFAVGATLFTAADTDQYFDGSYTGTYSITVNYQ